MPTPKIITYDLLNPDQNYKELYEYLNQYSISERITESTWIIFTVESCAEIKNNILKICDSNDRIFVGELTGIISGYNILCNDKLNDVLKNIF